jgi:hypothetical protein
VSPAVASLEEFAAAVESFSRRGEPVRWAPGAKRRAEQSLRRHGLLLVGEVHGVAENPLVIERLIAELGIRTVALEWPRGLEAALGDLARLGTLRPRRAQPINRTSQEAIVAAAAWCGDGRVTAGHFAVLRRTRVNVVAIDEPVVPLEMNARDAAMATNVEQALSANPLPMLVVAGNRHTMLSRQEHYTPAGMRLAARRPDLCAVDIHYAHGRFWNLGPRIFGPSTPPGHPHVVVDRATEAVVLESLNED